ncbi:hypothetical protein TKK_0003245 [Trichogramma kaykai]
MSRITWELLRRRSEHNEGEISTLEELSLHQENIERIELLNHACRDLKILLLQYNLISRIENLHKLKRLEYLNLALNNIEVIENLEGLESLKKLDLMVNFVGDARDVKCLRNNEFLEQLILTGNPCCDYDGYRDYVIATLPQLRELDMKPISRSDRIRALQRLARASDDVCQGYKMYRKFRETQKVRFRQRQEKEGVVISEVTDDEDKKDKKVVDSDEETDQFWKSKSSHTPEDRVVIAKKRIQQMSKYETRQAEKEAPQKRVQKFFNPAGKPYNINQPKVAFSFDDETDPDNIVLDVELYKHLDTSLVDVDVQPTYVRVSIKSKVLQLTLPYEVSTELSRAQRNTTTGHLVVVMPRLAKGPSVYLTSRKKNEERTKTIQRVRAEPEVTKREYLEIGPPRCEETWREKLTVCTEDGKPLKSKVETETVVKDAEGEEDFVDDPSVPPLESV